MLTRIMDVNDVQGPMIREHVKHLGPITPSIYARAHVSFLRTVPGSPVPHQSSLAVTMRIAGGQWQTTCPECHTGISTGRGWREARCFRCGAVFSQVIWPEDMARIERAILQRPLNHQHWRPEETIEDVERLNVSHGVGGMHAVE